MSILYGSIRYLRGSTENKVLAGENVVNRVTSCLNTQQVDGVTCDRFDPLPPTSKYKTWNEQTLKMYRGLFFNARDVTDFYFSRETESP